MYIYIYIYSEGDEDKHNADVAIGNKSRREIITGSRINPQEKKLCNMKQQVKTNGSKVGSNNKMEIQTLRTKCQIKLF